MSKRRSKKKSAANSSRRKPPMASLADRHELYQQSVQAVDAEIDFVDDEYKRLRGRRAVVLREDFGGTGNTSCEWVRRRPGNLAYAVDIDEPTQQWGIAHNIAKLRPAQRERVKMITADVLACRTPQKPDVILAMNFSYFIFQQREVMRRYFQKVRRDLAEGGLFFLDCYGGYESYKECTDPREVDDGGGGSFKYIWDQHTYNPISGEMTCYIHFHFPDGSKMRRAFEYTWRMWTLPEIREMLSEAGFRKSTVYWEGTDEETEEGDGNFEPTEVGEADPAWIAYIVAEP